ncbi:FimD/PapC N-terminal domain-containing protein [Shigella flexneri]
MGVFRLDFSVPQAWVEELESGYVPPENWKRGMNGLYLYYVSQYYSDYKVSGNKRVHMNVLTAGKFTWGGNCILMPVSVKQITIQGCGKAIPCIWNVDLPNFSALFAW